MSAHIFPSWDEPRFEEGELIYCEFGQAMGYADHSISYHYGIIDMVDNTQNNTETQNTIYEDRLCEAVMDNITRVSLTGDIKDINWNNIPTDPDQTNFPRVQLACVNLQSLYEILWRRFRILYDNSLKSKELAREWTLKHLDIMMDKLRRLGDYPGMVMYLAINAVDLLMIEDHREYLSEDAIEMDAEYFDWEIPTRDYLYLKVVEGVKFLGR